MLFFQVGFPLAIAVFGGLISLFRSFKSASILRNAKSRVGDGDVNVPLLGEGMGSVGGRNGAGVVEVKETGPLFVTQSMLLLQIGYTGTSAVIYAATKQVSVLERGGG